MNCIRMINNIINNKRKCPDTCLQPPRKIRRYNERNRTNIPKIQQCITPYMKPMSKEQISNVIFKTFGGNKKKSKKKQIEKKSNQKRSMYR
jgi:hypothetical protein